MKNTVKIALLIILALSVSFFGYKFLKNKNSSQQPTPQVQSAQKSNPPVNSKDAQVISTKPDLTDNPIVSEKDTIEIAFSDPLENIGELKYRIEPKPDAKIELSPDRKTVRITPNKPFDLGITYTIFITPESKFDGGKRLTGDRIYHFQTVKFRGF